MTQVIASLLKRAYAWAAKPVGNPHKAGNVVREIADDKRNKDTKTHVAASVASCNVAFAEFFEGYANYLTATRYSSTLGEVAGAKEAIKSLKSRLEFLNDKLSNVEGAINDRHQYLFPSSKEY